MRGRRRSKSASNSKLLNELYSSKGRELRVDSRVTGLPTIPFVKRRTKRRGENRNRSNAT